MQYIEWEAEAFADAGDGSRNIDHWQKAARRGNSFALAKINGPEFPEQLDYLWRWLYELHGRSGMHMSGVNPLDYATIKSWGELTGRDPTSLEVEALIRMDAALITGAASRDRAEAPEPTPGSDAWPEKKNG